MLQAAKLLPVILNYWLPQRRPELLWIVGRRNWHPIFMSGRCRRARLMDDSHAIADAAYNLAACLTDLGQYQSARAYLLEAKAEGRRAGGRITDVLLLEAMVAPVSRTTRPRR